MAYTKDDGEAATKMLERYQKYLEEQQHVKDTYLVMDTKLAEKMVEKTDYALDPEWVRGVQKLGEKLAIEGEEVPVEPPWSFLNNARQEVLVWYPRNALGTGYEDNTMTVGALSYFNIADLLARFFIQCHSQWGTIPSWRDNCIGISSEIMNVGFGFDSSHLPMFDYDGKNVKTQIRKDVKLLQKEYDLGNAWIYETRRGFHVYFFCDKVDVRTYFEMLAKTQCCKGFRRSGENRGYTVLRVSAKYTAFDIKPLYVLPARSSVPKRMSAKAHIIQALLALGEECGTHFASMFPQWAFFKQDIKEWKPPTKRPSAKRIKKVKSKRFNPDAHMILKTHVKDLNITAPTSGQYTITTNQTVDTSANYATTDNVWITSNTVKAGWK